MQCPLRRHHQLQCKQRPTTPTAKDTKKWRRFSKLVLSPNPKPQSRKRRANRDVPNLQHFNWRNTVILLQQSELPTPSKRLRQVRLTKRHVKHGSILRHFLKAHSITGLLKRTKAKARRGEGCIHMRRNRRVRLIEIQVSK